ncbi:MAG TPA: AAA family ATPase, partial [Micromonosporaceae bacterium]|nr:AAA family ATPase [Micromonosporaceae bacterium]
TMKAGLALGTLHGVVLGDPDVRLEYVVMGDAVDLAAAAEHVGAPGEVLVDQTLLDACAGIETARRRGRVHLVSGLVPPVAAPPEPEPEPVPAAEAATARLAPFLHRPIAARLLAGRGGLVNEHRKVSVAFVGLPEWAAERFQEFAVEAVRTIDRHGGHLLQIDTADKGNLLVVCFGAPVSHEDDEERAVRCCLDLLGLPGGPFRAGLTTAYAYCGEVGSLRRKEYLVMGDAVNLAARLMQAARPGQLLVDRSTHERVAESVVAQALQPVVVKGKAAPVPVWQVDAVAERAGRAAAGERLIGREPEVDRLRTLVDRAAAGRGQLVVITGEAGVGKSRLAAEAVRIATSAGFVPYQGAASARETLTSFFGWRPVWHRLLGLTGDQSLAARQDRLRERVAAIDGGSTHRAPLLAPVVNLPMADTDLTAGLDTATRSEALRVLLADVLRRRAAAGPTMIVLEDCHWLDAASARLLAFLAGTIAAAPVLFVVTARPDSGAATVLEPLTRLEHHRGLALPELTAPDAERLVTGRLRRLYGADVVLSAELLDALTARGAGNPFYLEELASLVHARGLDPADPQAVAAIELPDTLRSLLTARLDQLDEGEQATVKVASVIGQVFPASWVWGAYPQLGGADVVRGYLNRLDRLDLTPVRHAGPEPEFAFRHVLTQEAAYGTLTFAMRAQLHESVARFIERTYGPDLAAYVDALAYHYGRGDNPAKQLIWFRA